MRRRTHGGVSYDPIYILGGGDAMLPEILASLAATAATAVVAAMGTDAWESARSRVARLLGRNDRQRVKFIEAQLDEDATLVHDADERDKVRAELAPLWGRRLAGLLQANPDAAEELQGLIKQVRTELPPTQREWLQQYIRVTGGGTVFAQQGSGGQHIHYDRPSAPAGGEDPSPKVPGDTL
jgi:hypothetical protein